MIKSLRLVNWKSFADATLYIDPLTVVIGMNASGKSNILDALVFLQRIASGATITAAIAGDNALPSLRGGLEFSARRPKHYFCITATIANPSNSDSNYEYSISVLTNQTTAKIFSEELLIPESNTALFTSETRKDSQLLKTYFARGKQILPKRIDQNPFYSIISQTETMNISKEIKSAARIVREKLQSIFILDPIPSHIRDYAPLSETLKSDASNLAGVLASLPENEKTDIESTLTNYLKQLPEKDIERVWTERVGKFQSDAMLYCEENWGADGPQIVDARGMSDGTLRFLAIVAALLTCKEGSLLVIEEVDNGLHPSRADTLVEMLRTLGARRSIDVIVTTHNPALLNALGPEMAPFISVTHRDASGASAITLLEDIEQLPKIMASGPLGRIVSEGRLETALQAEAGR
ncbi:MAG: AAA family ATPase [Solidesulfovibrio sp. DCME]|uniref:AAA family ATPase n=1 Tax=Solidesulfovibrio sp. DCME TaxID=3447380 RepID=UPI003D0DB60A